MKITSIGFTKQVGRKGFLRAEKQVRISNALNRFDGKILRSLSNEMF